MTGPAHFEDARQAMPEALDIITLEYEFTATDCNFDNSAGIPCLKKIVLIDEIVGILNKFL